MADSPLRPTDDDARLQARTLLRRATAAALATTDEDGMPAASLTAIATAPDGTPIGLVSRLSGHTANLLREGRAGLLVAQTGRGDPLAHPRLSVSVKATFLSREEAATGPWRRRYLAHNPKAALYADFPDFSFVRFDIVRAALNGGFGKAYELAPADLLLSGTDALSAMEEGAIEHMNADHAEAVSLYATRLCAMPEGPWRLCGIDPEGIDMLAGDLRARLPFGAPIADAAALRQRLAALAAEARSRQPAA